MRGPLSPYPGNPAVVVGGTLNGLGVVRSLSRGRVPVIVLDNSRRCPAAWSRHCRFVPVPSIEGGRLVDSLVRLASDLACRPVLILTTDSSVMTVSACRDRIEPLYHIDLPAHEMVEALADKAAFHSLAATKGFAVPRGVAIARDENIDRIGELVPPVVIKPADKTLVLAGAVERAVRADTIAQARTIAADMLRRASPLIVQEWIEGPDTEIYFTLFSCDRESRLRGIFPGRKLVCSPPAVGSTAICAAAPDLAEELCDQTAEFVRQVAYRGLGGLELKRHALNGRLLIVEPTVGRTDWQEEIATLCGVNVPLIAYRAALGQAVTASQKPPPGPLVWRSDRIFSLPRDVTVPSMRIIDGYFRWSDPLPAAYYYAYEGIAARLWRRANHLIRPSSKLTVGAH